MRKTGSWKKDKHCRRMTEEAIKKKAEGYAQGYRESCSPNTSSSAIASSSDIRAMIPFSLA